MSEQALELTLVIKLPAHGAGAGPVDLGGVCAVAAGPAAVSAGLELSWGRGSDSLRRVNQHTVHSSPKQH